MTDTTNVDIWMPPADWRIVKLFRFANLLDDAKNVLSPVKCNVWFANLAGVSTIFATIAAFVTAHWATLAHVMDVAPTVGTYLAGSHAWHHADKAQRNAQQVRMKEPA